MLFSVKGQRVNSPIFLHESGVLSHLESVEDTTYQLIVKKVATDSDLNAQGQTGYLICDGQKGVKSDVKSE